MKKKQIRKAKPLFHFHIGLEHVEFKKIPRIHKKTKKTFDNIISQLVLAVLILAPKWIASGLIFLLDNYLDTGFPNSLNSTYC